MNKILITGCAVATAFAAVAMPTKQELAQAQKPVEEATKADLAAFKAGQKTAKEVADSHLALAAKAENQAEKYLYYQGAFKLYARSGEYSQAIDVLDILKSDVKDVSPEVINELVGQELRGIAKEQGEQINRLQAKSKTVPAASVRPASLLSQKAQFAKDIARFVALEKSQTDKTRKAVSMLFPGWSLDTEVLEANVAGFHASYRGQENVVCVLPKNMKTPAIVSRTEILSEKNPCLFLTVASWAEDADFLLSVRVNGKDALPSRLICTPDSAPWEDLVVPLSDWRGNAAKIEVVFTANGWHSWWPENPMLARLEIAEGNGDMCIVEGKATIDGYTWSYRTQNGEATIIDEKNDQFSCAVSPGPVGHLAIPATINGARVTRIGRDALARCGNLKSVIIPDGVKCIDRGAFYECGMKSVKIPSSVTSIGIEAFKNCIGLTEVSIPSGVNHIALGAFDSCSGLTSVIIPDSVKSIGAYAFKNCRRLASAKIPEGVTRVGRDAFAGCDSLEQVTIPSSLSHIEWGMFGNCLSLESVTILPGVRSIGQWAFVNCNSLTEVTIPPGVCSIDNGAFRYCNAIKTVSLPASVTNIHGCAFCESGTLMSFRVAEDNPVYKSENGLLLTKDGTALVHGVNGTVTIPSTVTNIQWCAFEGFRALEPVVIPSNVKTIGDYAFKNCYGLTSVTMLGERPNIGSDVFKGCCNLKAIHVPAKAKSWAGMKEWQGIPLVFDAK